MKQNFIHSFLINCPLIKKNSNRFQQVDSEKKIKNDAVLKVKYGENNDTKISTFILMDRKYVSTAM